jgi:hypothetical protein
LMAITHSSPQDLSTVHWKGRKNHLNYIRYVGYFFTIYRNKTKITKRIFLRIWTYFILLPDITALQ